MAIHFFIEEKSKPEGLSSDGKCSPPPLNATLKVFLALLRKKKGRAGKDFGLSPLPLIPPVFECVKSMQK